MKKKIIIVAIAVFVISVCLCLLFLKKGEMQKVLVCNLEEQEGSKIANISYTYTIKDDNIIYAEAVTELSFMTKEETDKYEKIVNIAFVKDEIVRNGNKIIITSKNENDKKDLSLEEIKKKQEENGFTCNYK